MSGKSKSSEGNNKAKLTESPWMKAFVGNAEWPDKEEFLDVIYWMRQAIGIILGLFWGLLPLKGFLGLVLFVVVNAAVIYIYVNNFQNIDEEEYGGMWEITKEGFMTSFAGFLEEFLDVIYWMRQAIGIILGLFWGLLPLKGFLGLVLFVVVNAAVIYIYVNNFQNIDEEEYGGMWEITKEGFMTSFAGFLVTWIIVYTGLHIADNL